MTSAMLGYDALDAKAVLSLDGRWGFVTDEQGKLNQETAKQSAKRRTILVPGCWEAQFDDLVGYDGIAWYWREFNVPASFQGKRLLLRFDAVDYFAQVWLNGRELGSHEGGYLPFVWEVQDKVRFDAPNELVVKVVDPTDEASRFPDFPLSEVPNGKQSHYCNIGGLWQSVYLIARPNEYIKNVFVTPNVNDSSAQVKVRLARPATRELHLRVRVGAERERKHRGLRASRWISAAKATVSPGSAEATVVVQLKNVRLWSPRTPNLYRAEVELISGDEVDRVATTFGMRSIEARDGRLYLNGEQIYWRAALDQDFYPDTIYAPPSDDFLKEQFCKAKQLGLNGMRVHIKIPHPRYLDWADRIGLLLWVDFPSWYRFNDKVSQRVERQVREWIERDFNHPSIFAYCLVNEEWGLNLDVPENRAWLKKMYHTVKQLDPTRLVVDNSPLGQGHIISDIEDQHVYMNIPERADNFERWTEEFSKHPNYTFRYPDSQRRKFEPLIISEFGNWGLPDVEKLLRYYNGKEPYWFHQNSYGGPIHGGLEAFRRFRLDEVYGGLPQLAQATQRHQLEALKFQIETIRRFPSIVGYVITQFTDLNSESNGLLDMCRNVKGLKDLNFCQRDTVVLAHTERTAWWAGETVKMDVYVSHFASKQPIQGAKLSWTLEVGLYPSRKRAESFSLRGLQEGIEVEAGEGCKVASISFVAPEVSEAQKARVWLMLEESVPSPSKGEGRKKGKAKEITRNYHDLWFFPSAYRRVNVGAGFHTPRKRVNVCVYQYQYQYQHDNHLTDLRSRLRLAGWQVVEKPTEAEVVLSERMTPELLEVLMGGGKVLLLAERTDAFGDVDISLRVRPRSEKGWWGDWATSFLWLRSNHPFFQRLPYEGHIGMAYRRVIPHTVLDGITPEQMKGALGGIFVAWMHNPAVTCGLFRVGQGLLMPLTFRLAESFGSDPVATVMLNDLLEGVIGISTKSIATPPLEVEVFDKVFVSTGEREGQAWRYTTQKPPDDWMQLDFDDSGWRTGLSGFGREGTPNIHLRTRWLESDIWLRFKGKIDSHVAAAKLRFYHDEDVEIYLNAHLIAKRTGYVTDYIEQRLSDDDLKHFMVGENLLAVHCRQTVGGQYVDVGLVYR